jgi:hypothetical protein
MAQENRPILSPRTVLGGAPSDDLLSGGMDALAGTETAPETALETVSSGMSASSQGIPASPAPRLRPTPFRRRLPRFVRAKRSHRPPIALQDRDLELLRTVSEYRLISTRQLLLLFEHESTDGIYRRLQRLFHHGYLNRIGTNPNAPLVYSLARRGADVLEVSQQKDVGDRYVAHQLMIGDFRVAIGQAAKALSIDVSWRPVQRESPVQPDGLFSLRFPDRPEGANRAFFCLEADRSTMPRRRFVEKLLAYQAWYASGGHTAALGIKSFRVLTATKSPERLTSLLAALAHEPRLTILRRACWFAVLPEAIGADGVFEPIWQTADDPGAGYSLLPPAPPKRGSPRCAHLGVAFCLPET